MKNLNKKLAGVCFAGLLGIFMSVSAVGQGCNNPTQNPSQPVTPNEGFPTTISSCQKLQQYSVIDTEGGEDYEFTVTGGGYITVRKNWSSGPVLAMGPSPLTVSAPVSFYMYVHWNTDSSCGTATDCQTSTVRCVTCPAIYDCPDLSHNIGDPCDDGNPNTINDVVTDSCECVGVVPPANDDCVDAIALTCGVRDSSSTFHATSSGVDPQCGDFPPFYPYGYDVWYKFTADGTSNYTVNLYAADNSWNGVLFVYSGSCDSLTSLGCSDSTSGGGEEAVFLTAPEAGTYYIRLFSWLGVAQYSVELNCGADPPCPTDYPDVSGMTAEQQGNDFKLSWDPIGGSIGCRIFVGTNYSNRMFKTISGNNVSTFTIPGQYLNPGTTYNWGVRCGCSQNPLVAGYWSYSTFTVPSGGAITFTPNPTSEVSNVSFKVIEEGNTALAVYDMTGRLVKTLFSGGASPESEYRFAFDVSGLPTGVYIYRLTTAGETVIEKFMISK